MVEQLMRGTVRGAACALAASAALVVAACGGTAATEAENGEAPAGSGPIKVGVIAAFSGPNASYGEGPVAAIDMLVSNINEAGGIHDRQIELIKRDGACDPTRAIAGARALRTEDITAFIGPSCSPSGEAIKDLVLDMEIPWMSTVATTAPYEPLNPWAFNANGPSSATQARAALAFGEARDLKRAALLRQSDTYGDEAEATINEVADEYDVELVADVAVAPDATDTSAQVQEIREADPDYVILASYFAPAGVFLRQAPTAGLDVPMVGFVATAQPQILSSAPPEALANFFGETSTADVPGGPGLAEFEEQFRQSAPSIASREGEPSTLSVMFYSSAETLFEAMRRAEDLTPEAIAASMETLGGYTPANLAGPLTFSETNHDGISSVAFFTVDPKTGKAVISDTVVEVPTAE